MTLTIVKLIDDEPVEGYADDETDHHLGEVGGDCKIKQIVHIVFVFVISLCRY
jgi:hypothetical protein